MSARLGWGFGVCCLCLWAPAVTFAGHGFASAFTNIEWLPDPGRTPDSAWYRLDGWQEEGQLLLARTTEEQVQLCLAFAREKLAELEAMVKAQNTPAAETAAGVYRSYVGRAKQLVSEGAGGQESARESVATALLEHQYILSVIYEELPRETRAVVLRVMTGARENYQEVAKLLPAKRKGALFFKEEEVRWSVDMAARADEEGPQN